MSDLRQAVNVCFTGRGTRARASVRRCSKTSSSTPSVSVGTTRECAVLVEPSERVMPSSIEPRSSVTPLDGTSRLLVLVRRWWSCRRRVARAVAIAAVVVIAGCGDSPTEPTPDSNDPTPLQLALAARYQERFGQRIPRPAVFDPFNTSPCTPRHVASTAWLGDGTTRQLLTLYTVPVVYLALDE